MQLAKVTAKGQITVPVDVRRKLGLNEGSYILFVERDNGFFMINENRINLNTVGGTKTVRSGWSDDFANAFLDPGVPSELLIEEYDDIPWAAREEFI